MISPPLFNPLVPKECLAQWMWSLKGSLIFSPITVGSAFDKEDLDEELRAAYEAIGEGGMIYASFEHSFWIRHKGLLIRVM